MSQASIADRSLVVGSKAARPAWYEPLLDGGVLPDVVIRAGIRSRLRAQVAHEERGTMEERRERFRTFLDELRRSPVAIETRAANEQHYEVPAAFFRACLGPRMKYSGCYWPKGVRTLDVAEEAMLALTCERARIADGQEILELGCGWGSLTLWLLENYPRARVTAVSNSASQRAFILAEAERRGLRTPEIITADMRDFVLDRRFDRVVSVEMFEHMKNYGVLMQRIAGMLRPEGLLFVHIFTHARIAYHFVPGDDWIGRYFFTGGTMPSAHLLHHFQEDLRLVDHWDVDGTHYQRTANAWLGLLDANREAALEALRSGQGPAEARAWLNRWRVFFMACAELWGLDRGREWMVSHYLFGREGARRGQGSR
jgi:cyclopropane-fatty-acyl-phospholipid synthase